jgi:hypothetical protein
LEFKNIILEEKLSKKYKNSYEKFSGGKVSMVSGLLPWREALRGRKVSWPFLNLFDDFSSKMMFSNSKKSFQSMGSEVTLRTNLKVSRNFLF